MVNYISPNAKVPFSRVAFEGEAVILGSSTIGERTRIGLNVLIGYPSREKWKGLVFGIEFGPEQMDRISEGALIGESCVLRSNTIIYERVVIESAVSTGHNVMLRENTTIAKNSLIGSGTLIDGNVVIGENASIQSGVYLPPLTTIRNRVFIGPNAVVTNDRYPPSSKLVGVTVEDDAVIGANATLLAGITIREGGVVAAGAVVTRDVRANTVVAGVPAKEAGTRDDYDRKRKAYQQLGI